MLSYVSRRSRLFLLAKTNSSCNHPLGNREAGAEGDARIHQIASQGVDLVVVLRLLGDARTEDRKTYYQKKACYAERDQFV